MAVSPRLPVRPPDLRERLLMEFDMSSSMETRSVSYTLLRPVHLRLATYEMAHKAALYPSAISLDLEATSREKNRDRGEEMDKTEGEKTIIWQSVYSEEVDARSTQQCLWEFILLWNKDPQDVLRFVQKWGILDWIDLQTKDPIKAKGSMEILDMRRESVEAFVFLAVMIATLDGELASDDQIRWLDDSKADEYFFSFTSSLVEAGGHDKLDEYLNQFQTEGIKHPLQLQALARRHLRREYRRLRCTAGEGLAHQQEMLLGTIEKWVEPLGLVPAWDRKGRRLELAATGVRQIVGAQLGQIFDSQTIDIYACSICGKIYPFDEAEGHRRPKRGARRFCSDSCRLEAKRIDNLAAWHRNKERWTNRSRSPKGVADHGQAGQ